MQLYAVAFVDKRPVHKNRQASDCLIVPFTAPAHSWLCLTGDGDDLLNLMVVMRVVHLSIALEHMRPERVPLPFVLLHVAIAHLLGLHAIAGA